MTTAEGGPEPSPFAGFADPRARSYLEALAGLLGDRSAAWVPTRAAAVAGIDHGTAAYWRRTRPAFRRAEEEAMRLGAECLRAAAVERATTGFRRRLFDRNGHPLLDTDTCDGCGHARQEHRTDAEHRTPGPRVLDATPATCGAEGCGCQVWQPAPYTEAVASDRVLERLLGAALPDEFAAPKRLEVSSALRRLDVAALPHDLLGRIADGEPLELVLAELVGRGLTIPLDPTGEILQERGPGLLLPGGAVDQEAGGV